MAVALAVVFEEEEEEEEEEESGWRECKGCVAMDIR